MRQQRSGMPGRLKMANHQRIGKSPLLWAVSFLCVMTMPNKNVKDYGYQIVLLAKNKKGYHNLAKMSSLAYTDGFYYVPRIDRKIVPAVQGRYHRTHGEPLWRGARKGVERWGKPSGRGPALVERTIRR